MSNCKQCRRDFLKLGSMSLLVSAIEPRLLRASPELDRLRTPGIRPSGKTLIHIWLRGGQDGLNLVVPTEAGEYATYQSYRPGIGLSMSSLTGQPLGPDFALHPVTQPGLFDLYSRGMLAALPTVGYPDSSRSHFEGQKLLENGTPGNNLNFTGWMNRWLQASGLSSDPLQAVSFTNGVPLLLVGPFGVMSLTTLGELAISRNAARAAKYLAIERDWYGNVNPVSTYDAEVATAGSNLVNAIESIEMRQPLPPPDPGANYPSGWFGDRLRELAQLIRAGFQIEVANVELNGWDHHTQQNQPFLNLLGQLSNGIHALVTDLGPSRMQDTVIVTASEFGRTARENGSSGTDHGNAWTSLVVSPGVNPGVHTRSGWPGLDSLRDNRDLAYTIDFRDLFGEILLRHMGLLPPTVFPGWSHTPVGFLA